MRHIDNIKRDMKATKAELIRLETKLERLQREYDETVRKLLED